jgi:hypothetical protein
MVLLRCNNNGDLYTIPHHLPPRCHVAVVSPELWHSRLGHPAPAVVNTLNKLSAIQYNKAARHICHACQLGKHARLHSLVRFLVHQLPLNLFTVMSGPLQF